MYIQLGSCLKTFLIPLTLRTCEIPAEGPFSRLPSGSVAFVVASAAAAAKVSAPVATCSTATATATGNGAAVLPAKSA